MEELHALVEEPRVLGLVLLMSLVELVEFEEVCHFLKKPYDEWFFGSLILFF